MYASDPTFCEQIQAMIKEKPEYDWGNFCATSGNIIECKTFLSALKEVEFYVHYIKSLSEQTQELFQTYKPELKQVSNSGPEQRPIVRTVSNDELDVLDNKE